jgi:RES domain-containing protein
VRVWRLCKKAHAVFDGEGARRAGGRWNRRGTPVVYASQSISLAALELLVHADPAFLPGDLVAIAADVPDALSVESIEIADLPRDWRRYPAPESLADRGTEWTRAGRTAVLSVPSAVVPQERNYLLNPAHPDFRRIRTGKPEPFDFDGRLKPSLR